MADAYKWSEITKTTEINYPRYKDFEEYFKVDDMFTATLKKEEGEKYWHINVETLERA